MDFENSCFSRDDATPRRLKESAIAANGHEFFMRDPLSENMTGREIDQLFQILVQQWKNVF